MYALLMLAQAATTPIVTPAPVATDAASDARCIVVLGFIGASGAGEQQEATKRGIGFFLGKLTGRDPRVDIAGTIRRAAAAAQAAGLNARAEADRCGAEINRAGQALAAMRGTTPAAPVPGDVPRVPTQPGR